MRLRLSIRWLLLCAILVGYVYAAEKKEEEDDDGADDLSDFSNDLATDLGPLLALFGEFLTRQYLSESTSFLDYFIFAMGPIGILTAMVSVIRVCGHSSIRAFVGRSQEGEGTVEAELCTSTSRDVCELFNTGSITRVLGRPYILELVYVPSDESGRGAAGAEKELFLFRHYLETYEGTDSFEWLRMRESLFGRDSQHKAGPRTVLASKPNLSLNVGIKKPASWVLFVVAVVGFIMQAGVVAMAGVGVWILGWNLNKGTSSASRDYAPLMFIVGTVTMCFGMWACAALIGQTTHEIRYRRTPGSEKRNRLIWLQPGPQVVGDQNFDPFAYFEATEDPLRVWTSSRKDFNERFQTYTFLAVAITLLGYIAQFIGLRGMRAWVSLAQLGTTVLMSVLRGLLRVQRLGKDANKLSGMPDLIAGHELDWLAFEILRQSPDSCCWHITGRYEKATEVGPSKTVDPFPKLTESSSKSSGEDVQVDTVATTPPTDGSTCSVDDGRYDSVNYHKLLFIRERLSHLTGNDPFKTTEKREIQAWDDDRVKVRSMARKVSQAICQATENLFQDGPRKGDITLQIQTAAGPRDGNIANEQLVAITLKPPPESIQSGWTIDSAKLEAILGLYLWSLLSDEGVQSRDDSGNTVSLAESVNVMRIISAGVDNGDWHRSTDKGGEMNLWFGSSSVKLFDTRLSIDRGGCGLIDLWEALPTATGYKRAAKETSTANQEKSKEQIKVRFSGCSLVNHSAVPIHSVSSTASPPTVAYPDIRVQYMPINHSLLDVCAQELFTALANSLMSLVPIKQASIVESDGHARLDSPAVTVLAKAFTENGLGSHHDALSCIIPGYGSKIRPDPEEMVSALIEVSKGYRQKSEWKRAETLMLWACSQFGPSGSEEPTSATYDHKLFERALRAIGELYRWSFAQNIGERREFGIRGIKWMVDTYTDTGERDLEIKSILQCYDTIGQRVLEYPVGQGVRQRLEPSSYRQTLARAIHERDRTEALFYLCFATVGDFGSTELQPALPLAARNDWQEMVVAILEMKANVDSQDEQGRTAACHCAQLGHVDLFSQLMSLGAFLDRHDNLHQTPLLLAAKAGQVGVVNVIVQSHQADYDTQDSFGRTPLWWAAFHGHEAVVHLLVEGGADIELKNTSGEDAVVGWLDGQRTPLLVAAMNGHEGTVRYLREKGAVVATKDIDDKTPLALAAKNGHEGAVRFLLEEGADPNATVNSTRRTPLMLAVMNGHKTIAQMLLEKGANIDAQDSAGWTALMIALKTGHEGVARLLISKGGNLELKDTFERTALFFASESGCDTIVQLLLEKGANPATRNTRVFFDENILINAKKKRLSF